MITNKKNAIPRAFGMVKMEGAREQFDHLKVTVFTNLNETSECILASILIISASSSLGPLRALSGLKYVKQSVKNKIERKDIVMK